MKIKKKSGNDVKLNCLFFMLIIFPITNLVISTTYFIHINLENISLIFYGMLWLYGVRCALSNPIKKKDLLCIVICYIIYIFLFFVSGSVARKEFISGGMIINYLYYIPLSILIVSHITEWGKLFTRKFYLIIADIVVVLSLLSKLFFNDTTEYMAYSYGLLPIWGLIIVSALHYKKKSQKILIPFIVLQAIVYGSRGALGAIMIVSVAVFILEYYYKTSSKNKCFRSLLVTFLAIALICVGLNTIIPRLVNSSLFDSSYILRRIQLDIFTENSSRHEITNICLREIGKMGFNVNGLFYDRQILPEGMYSHNFILESLLSLGWIFGIMFLAWILYNIVSKYIRQNKEGKIILFYFIGTLFLRYFISGSIFTEGKFILFMAILMSFKYTSYKNKSGITLRDYCDNSK